MAPQDLVFDPSDFESEDEKSNYNIGEIARRLGGAGIRVGANILGSEGMATGAAINAGGETLAQMLENWSLDPSKLNKSAITASGAIGAIPMASLLKAGSKGWSAARTIGAGYGSTAAMKAVQDNPETGKKEIFENPNKVLNPLEWSNLDKAGLAVAGIGGALGAKIKITPEAKAARDAAKEAQKVKDAAFAAERRGGGFKWGTAFDTEAAAKAKVDELNAAGNPAKIRKKDTGYHVVPEGSLDGVERSAEKATQATVLKTGAARRAKENLEKILKDREGVVNESMNETFTYVDPETGKKVTYKRVMDTPTNRARQEAISTEGLESKGKTVTKTTTVENPLGKETSSERFAKPAPKNPEDGNLGGGDDSDLMGAIGDDAPTLGNDPEIVVENGKVVPKKPSILEPMEDVVEEVASEAPVLPTAKPEVPPKKGPALKVSGKGKKAKAEVPPVVETPQAPKNPVVQQLKDSLEQTNAPAPPITEAPLTPKGPAKEPMRKSSRFYKDKPELLEKGRLQVEKDLAEMPDPTGTAMPVSDLASPELKALAIRTAKLRDLYPKHQAAFKAGQVMDEVPASSALMMKAHPKEAVSKMADEETVKLLQQDLDEIAANGGKIPESMGGTAAETAGSKYDYTQPTMTLEQAAEATGTPLRTIERAIKAEGDKKLQVTDFGVDKEGKPFSVRRIPIEWLNEWIALGNGGPGKRGRPPLSSQTGAISPLALTSVTGAVGGGVAGSNMDEENPTRGAILGALAGAAAPHGAMALGKINPVTSAKIGNFASEVKKTIPDAIRSNFLSDADSIIANTAVGPIGSGFWAGLEKGLGGDSRGWKLLDEMKPWASNFMGHLKNRDAADFISEAERAEMMPGEATNIAQKLFSLPGEAMATGDLTTYNAARRAGFSKDEALRITLQSQDLNYPTPRNIMGWGRNKTESGKVPELTKYLLPFKNTAANILDAGFDRLPGIGYLANRYAKDPTRRLENNESLAQQGISLGIATTAYQLGKNVDPQNAAKWRKYISNGAGPYSMVANAAFSAGLAAQEGASLPTQGFDAAASGLGDFPLPTTRIPQELMKFGVAWGEGNLTDPGMHPELEGPARYLPKGTYPGIVQNMYDWTHDNPNSGEDFGIGGMMRRLIKNAQQPTEEDPFDFIQ